MRKRGKRGGGGRESLGARRREEDEEGRLRREREDGGGGRATIGHKYAIQGYDWFHDGISITNNVTR